MMKYMVKPRHKKIRAEDPQNGGCHKKIARESESTILYNKSTSSVAKCKRSKKE